MNRREWGWAVAGLGLGAAFLYLAFHRVSLGELRLILSSGHPVLVLAALFSLVSIILKGFRWKVLMGRAHPAFTYRAALATTFLLHAANNVLPARAGEVLRPAASRRLGGARTTEGLGLQFLDRVFDVVSFFALALLALPFLGGLFGFTWGVGLAAAATLALFAALVVLARRRRFRGETPVPHGRLGWLVHHGHAFLDGLGRVGDARVTLLALAFSLASWLSQVLVLRWVAQAYGLGLAFGASFLVLFLVNLAIALPGAPSGFGAFEFGAATGLSLVGADPTLALAIALAFHAVQWVPSTLAGGVVAIAFARRPPPDSPRRHGPEQGRPLASAAGRNDATP